MGSFCGWVGAIGIVASICLAAAAFMVHPVMQLQFAAWAGATFFLSVITGGLGEIIDLLRAIRDRPPAP